MNKPLARALLIVGTLLHGVAIGGPWAPWPVSTLVNRADHVVIAALRSAPVDEEGVIHTQLELSSSLKGSALSAQVVAVLRPSPIMRTNKSGTILIQPSRSSGLWFLKTTEEGKDYEILPLADGDYTWDDAFIPLRESQWPADEGPDLQKALRAALNWYVELTEPTPLDDHRLLISLNSVDPSEALNLSSVLAKSPLPRQRIVGLAASIRLSSDEALFQLASEVNSLQVSPIFVHITNALQMNYRPHGESSLPVLEQLVSLRSNAPGLDDALASALQRINTKAILPSMAVLLNSYDSQARLKAASNFGSFALFADKDGNISGANMDGPFYSEAVRAAVPRRDSSRSPADYAAFWTAWWQENRSKLGFAER